MRIAFDGHELFDTHRAVLADAAQVVATQIDQHDMLGALFGIGEEFGFERAVLVLIPPPPPRACDGAVEGLATLYPQQHLGRAADDADRPQPQEIHVGRGIDDAQRAIDLERIGPGLRKEALAGHDLKGVPGTDVAQRAPYGRQKTFPREVGIDAKADIRAEMHRMEPVPAWPRYPPRAGLHPTNQGAFQKPPDPLHALDRRPIAILQSIARLDRHGLDHPDRMTHVIEDHQACKKHQQRLVEIGAVAFRHRDALDQTHHLVGEVANGTGHQRRHARQADGAIASQQLPQHCQRRLAQKPTPATGLEHATTIPVTKDLPGMHPDERIASRALAAFDALEQAGVGCPGGQAQEGSHRCQQIGAEDLAHRDQIALARKLAKRFQVGKDHRAVAERTARHMACTGAGREVHNSHWAAAWATNMRSPDTVRAPRCAASRSRRVRSGRYTMSKTTSACNSSARSGARSGWGIMPTGVAFTTRLNSLRASWRRSMASPPTARASPAACSGRRAQMNTCAPASASAKAAARAAPPAPRSSTRAPDNFSAPRRALKTAQ